MGANQATANTIAGPTAVNPFISQSNTTPITPTIAGLVGGAEAFGRLPNSVEAGDLVLPDGSVDENGVTLPNGSSVLDADFDGDAFAGIVRLDTGPSGFADDYVGYDWLFVFNAGNDSLLEDVRFGAATRDGVPANEFEEIHLETLVDGGFANDDLFGGLGDVTNGDLQFLEVYATLIPESVTDFTYALTVDSDGTLLSGVADDLGNGDYFFVSSSVDIPVLDATWTGTSGNWSSASNWALVFADTQQPPTGGENPACPRRAEQQRFLRVQHCDRQRRRWYRDGHPGYRCGGRPRRDCPPRSSDDHR